MSLAPAHAAGNQANAPISECREASASDSDFPNSLVVNLNVDSEGLVAAWYDGATDRYRHGVLGDEIEASELHVISNHDGEQCAQRVVLAENEVFEDLAPRLVDMDGDNELDVVAVVSDNQLGAKLAVFGQTEDRRSLELKSATPNIGTVYRWLAPIGTGDFNGDGLMDVAFVDRPHLARVLRVYSYSKEAGLFELASATGFTNHRIGEDFISSGIRACDGRMEIVTVDPRWERILATTLTDKELTTKDVGAFDGIDSIKAALECGS